MAKKTQTPVVPVVPVVPVASEVMGMLAESRVMQDQALSLSESSKELAIKAVAMLRDAKVVIGSLKTCAFAQAFRDDMLARISPKTGKPYAEGSISNMLSAIRDAIKTGKAIDWNKSRTNAKAKPEVVKGTNTKSNVAPEDTKPSAVTTTEAEKTPAEKMLPMLQSVLALAQGDETAKYNQVDFQKHIKAALAMLQSVV